MAKTLIKNATIVNEGKIFQSDVFLQNGTIQEVSENIDSACLLYTSDAADE